jgi:hypothetical protein
VRGRNVLKPIFVVAACIFALMLVIKDGRVLRTSGLTGSCATVAGSAAADATGNAVVEACKPGKLEGRPNLTKRNCTAVGIAGKLEYWRCPADLQASDVGR